MVCCYFLVLLFSVVFGLFLLILATNKSPVVINKELNDIYYDFIINSNNTKAIKSLLSTNKGTKFAIKLNKIENKINNKQLWSKAIQQNDLELLHILKSLELEMRLRQFELADIYKTFNSVDYYETLEFLFDNYVILDKYSAYNLVSQVINALTTPNNEKQQIIQFKIIYKAMKLIKYQTFRILIKSSFYNVISSLNVPLVKFIIKGLNIDYNGFLGLFLKDDKLETILQLLVGYFIDKPNINNEFAYKMFDYLLSIVTNVDKLNSNGNDVYFYIERIKDENIKDILKDKIKIYKGINLFNNY